MSTIIRIKRKLNEDQAVDEKIVLNIKRLKTNDESADTKKSQNDEKTVLMFAGTVDQTLNTEEYILKLTKSEAERIVSRKTITESKLQKRLSENREKAQKNRFKVLNYTRSCSKPAEESNDEALTIVDVEKEKQAVATSSGSSSSNSLETEYVYDIYIAEKTPASIQNSEPLDINDLSILDYNDYLYSCPRLTNDSDDEMDANSSDSNDENYYKNDYPDDEDDVYSNDDDGSIGEREMRRAIQNFGIDNDLSSDDNEDFVYSVNAEGIEFEDDLDFADVERYGRSYAQYKKKMLREMEDDDDDDAD